MTKDEILERVRQIIGKQFSVSSETITRDTAAMDVSGWDSVTHVYLLLAIEQGFGVRIPDDRVFSMDNVGDLVDVLDEQMVKR
jgi:acyl carrier protein